MLNPKRRCKCTEHTPTAGFHGTDSGYGYHACRCDRCREYGRKKSAKFARNNRAYLAARQRAYYAANREKCLQWAREHSKKPEVQDRKADYNQRYYQEYRERILIKDAEYREYVREYRAERQARYAKSAAGIATKERSRQRRASVDALATRRGVAWTREEDAQLWDGSPRTVAVRLGRTVNGVETRRRNVRKETKS